MHRMPQPTWGRAGTHTPEERVYWLNTIIFMTSQCVLKNRSFGNQNQNASLQNYWPNFLDPFYICKIQKNILVLANSLFLGVQFNFVFGGSVKILQSLFLDTMCMISCVFPHLGKEVGVWEAVVDNGEGGVRMNRYIEHDVPSTIRFG